MSAWDARMIREVSGMHGGLTGRNTPGELAMARRLCEAQPDSRELLMMLGLEEPDFWWQRPNRPRKGPPTPRRKPSPCGTANRYKAGCRCDECRVAMAAYRRANVPPIQAHGTETAYKNSYCRCQPCKQAASVASKLRRTRAMAA